MSHSLESACRENLSTLCEHSVWPVSIQATLKGAWIETGHTECSRRVSTHTALFRPCFFRIDLTSSAKHRGLFRGIIQLLVCQSSPPSCRGTVPANTGNSFPDSFTTIHQPPHIQQTLHLHVSSRWRNGTVASAEHFNMHSAKRRYRRGRTHEIKSGWTRVPSTRSHLCRRMTYLSPRPVESPTPSPLI